MLISAAVIEKSIFHVISANIARNCTNKVSRTMSSGSTIIKGPLLNDLRVSRVCYDFFFKNMCLFRCISANIAGMLKRFFEDIYLRNIMLFLRPKLNMEINSRYCE